MAVKSRIANEYRLNMVDFLSKHRQAMEAAENFGAVTETPTGLTHWTL
jgi:hypothetical protein